MTIDPETEKKLREYARILAESNIRTRLTGSSDPRVIYGEHIADALAGLPRLEKLTHGNSFIDVGTGGGLPGLVWAICRPDLRGVLLDSVGKKIETVKAMISSLGISNVEAVNARSEDFARERREFFDTAAARALASSPTLAEYLSPLVRIGGELVAFKGVKAASELEPAFGRWNELGLDNPSVVPYRVAGKELCLVVWEKISRCPKRYPRNPGDAGKKSWLNLSAG